MIFPNCFAYCPADNLDRNSQILVWKKGIRFLNNGYKEDKLKELGRRKKLIEQEIFLSFFVF
jgi:hypothetical protein